MRSHINIFLNHKYMKLIVDAILRRATQESSVEIRDGFLRVKIKKILNLLHQKITFIKSNILLVKILKRPI